jgi:dephospho-CoA kinase
VVLGILGGIASGKSAVARLLAGAHGEVLSADRMVHELLDSPDGLEWLAERFGPSSIGRDGRADRAAIARLVFDPVRGEERRAELERWTHPRVRARIMARLSEARAAGVPRVVLDVPLLLENDAQHGLVGQCDALVFVDAPEDERERRVRHERGWPAGELARREALQMPLAEKARRAHHVIQNHSSMQELERAVDDLLAALGAR